MLIGADAVAGTDGSQRAFNPATNAEIAEPHFGFGTPADVDRAARLAATAFDEYRALPLARRAAFLEAIADQIVALGDALLERAHAETGLPMARLTGERGRTVGQLRLFARVVRDGHFLHATIDPAQPQRQPLPRADLRLAKVPLGPVAVFGASNFPLAFSVAGGDTASALAAGCPVIVKPAELTPLTALAAAELALRAGLPPGVLNVLSADSAQSIAIGQVLCASDAVRHLSFTGSTEVGRILMAQCAPTVKKLALELGGNAPFIVFDDADLDSAVEGALASKYRNAGQTCVCANRLYVQAGVYEAFLQKFAAKVGALQVGNGFAEGISIGPLIEPAALDKVQRHLDDAIAQGARVLVGGQRLSALGSGQFFAPTVLADCHAAMLCAREETFGPLAPVFRFDTEQEAIAAANATEFGLASYFYSRDVGRIWRVSEALEYGMVGVNVGILATEHVPFGGMKQSGLGREGSHHGIDEYLELKYVCVGDVLR
jgi:succinate-semialdehyde dehydrogenase/glutarate-semialdehyde dehydrogenase